jgi:hypothetical protein
MTRERRRGLLAVSLVVAVGLFLAYALTDAHVVGGPTVYIRNETSAWAFVGLYGRRGDDEDMLSVRRWAPGMCASAAWTWHHPDRPDVAENGTTAMWAEPGTTSETTTTPFTVGQPLYVRIDADGGVHTGEPLPVDEPGCTPYEAKDGWSWSAEDP